MTLGLGTIIEHRRGARRSESLLGLAATWAGYPHADALAALGVAGFIAVAGYQLGRETIDALVDRAPEGLTEAMCALVAQTPGVARTEAIRLRTSGAQIVGEVIVSAPRTLSLERAAGISKGKNFAEERQ